MPYKSQKQLEYEEKYRKIAKEKGVERLEEIEFYMSTADRIEDWDAYRAVAVVIREYRPQYEAEIKK